MARHRIQTARRRRKAPIVGVLALTALLAGAVVVYRDRHDDAVAIDQTGSACGRVAQVVTAASFAPVLEALTPLLAQGDDCVRLEVEVADGRAAAGRVAQTGADLWIPDDSSWRGVAGSLRLAGGDATDTVVATSPIYMVTDQGTGDRLRAAGGSWLALSKLVVEGPGTRLVVRDPGGSGDGMVATGAIAEAVWLERGMDASALWLARAKQNTRTVTGGDAALPVEPGEVGLVPEYALTQNLPGTTVLTGSDHTPMLRYTWLPTAAAVQEPSRAAALERVRRELSGPAGAAALTAARLRGPDLTPPAGGATGQAPAPTAKPLDVLKAHHVEHVFATWYAQDRRTNLLVVVDVSGSMADPAPGSATPLITLVQQGCRSLGPLLPDDAQLGLWEFGVKLDGPRDHRVLLPTATLDQRHRQNLNEAINRLAARKTGTGLYDSILAAYTAARDAYRPGVLNQVLIFTDGRDEDDANSSTAEELSTRLKAAQDPNRPIQLSVIAFGQPIEAKLLEQTLKPVAGYVDAITTPDEVAAVFIHVAAGGLHG